MLVRRRTTLASCLRRETTEAERRLWRELRELRLPHRFRRQHLVGKHVVGFACPAAKLAIEIDGGQHGLWNDADSARSLEIARYGYRVIRFWNGDVMQNIAGVLQAIRQELETPSPPQGAERVGVRCGISLRAAAAHLTLPVADATGPLPLLPKGRRGQKSG